MIPLIKNIFRLFPAKQNDVDVWVTSTNLSGLLAAYAAVQNDLSAVLSGQQPVAQQLAGFDSLAPEGRLLLAHLLTEQQIQSVAVGHFDGIYRNGVYSEFDSVLGQGLQIDTDKLKQLLWQLLKASDVMLLEVPVTSVDHTEAGIHFKTADERVFNARWCLDCAGAKSQLTTAPLITTGPPLLIKREVSDRPYCLDKNKVEFNRTSSGWVWLAYDTNGVVTTTEYSPDFPGTEPETHFYNAQWYHREHYVDERVILLSPCAFRFDPASGMGMTVQIKAALLAARSLFNIIHDGADASILETGYEPEMQVFYRDIRDHLRRFYTDLGIL